jgi:hypothetical protein
MRFVNATNFYSLLFDDVTIDCFEGGWPNNIRLVLSATLPGMFFFKPLTKTSS